MTADRVRRAFLTRIGLADLLTLHRRQPGPGRGRGVPSALPLPAPLTTEATPHDDHHRTDNIGDGLIASRRIAP
ncbi:hypothetical protein [Streptomyces capillispiralis]|uniref:Uncharacterized protein n=1 Tax=Streptomyces capillispiralis TaxID=68182 RepID=A0A561TFV0_9ACTN|nr:hypothetical protein [Streptomyces capillispiralis]TWF85989.1 hypothetical protein FHX78_112947 [Streptomyces capillispiralis]GHH89418.1 hypothetical protein GCM10017779_00470 [Streptomyces capillispiralis]